MEYELLMINISRDFSGYSQAFRDSIGQYLIASYLRQHDFKAYVFAGKIGDCKRVISKELERDRTRIVGFYAAADNIRVVGHAIQWIKENYPDCKTIVGGPQAIGLDYHFFEETKNDFAITGEGEIPMFYLLSALIDQTCSLEEVPSLVRKHETEKTLIVNQCDKAVITDLDSIGYPVLEDSLTGDLRKGEIVGIITGRGCPFQCAFCYEGANAKNVRFRSISNVMQEVDYIMENNRKLSYLEIYDDTFTLKKERVVEFCDEIRKREIPWFCEGHITFVLNQRDTFRYMIDSGLTCIQFGIESGSNKVLQAYNKHTDYDRILEAIKICKEYGIHGITGNFIIGGALETRETLEKSKELARELIHSAKGIIELYTVYFAPYPNTRMVSAPKDFQIEIHDDLKEINLNTMRSPVVNTKALTEYDIYDLKQEFDRFLTGEYEKAAEESTKEDILQGLYQNGNRIFINPTWEKVYLSKIYIKTFLEHLSEDEQVFGADKYMIRSFEDVKVEGEILYSEAGEFSGLEKDVLSYATGVYSVRKMAEKFLVSIEQLEEVYKKLNQKCLAYMSVF